MVKRLLFASMLFTLFIISPLSISASSLSDFEEIIKDWGREQAKQRNLKLRWVELYNGSKTYPDKKISARVLKTDYIRVEENNEIRLIDEVERFKDNRKTQQAAETEITPIYQFTTSHRVEVTKGISLSLPLTVSAGYPPFCTAGISIIPTFSWNKTEEDLGSFSRQLGLKEKIIIPARTAQRVRLSINQVIYDVPVTGEIEIKGSVVCCFRKHFFSHPKQVLQQTGGEEKSITSGDVISFTDTKEETLFDKLEEKYPHFPDLEQSALEDIEQEVKEQLVIQPQEEATDQEKSSTPMSHSEGSFWDRVKGYYIETYPLQKIIKDFFHKNPNHPDKEYYRYDLERDRITFTTEGLLKGAHRTTITSRVLSDYPVETYPIDQYSESELEEMDKRKQYESKLL